MTGGNVLSSSPLPWYPTTVSTDRGRFSTADMREPAVAPSITGDVMKAGLRLALARLALCDTDAASNASMEFGKSTVLSWAASSSASSAR